MNILPKLEDIPELSYVDNPAVRRHVKLPSTVLLNDIKLYTKYKYKGLSFEVHHRFNSTCTPKSANKNDYLVLYTGDKELLHELITKLEHKYKR